MTGLDGWAYGTAFIGGDRASPGIAGRELLLLTIFGLCINVVGTDEEGTASSTTLTLLWFRDIVFVWQAIGVSVP